MATLPSPLFINLSIQQGLIHHLDPCPGAVERVTTTPHYDVSLLEKKGRVIHICTPPSPVDVFSLLPLISLGFVILPSTQPTGTDPTLPPPPPNKKQIPNINPSDYHTRLVLSNITNHVLKPNPPRSPFHPRPLQAADWQLAKPGFFCWYVMTLFRFCVLYCIRQD